GGGLRVQGLEIEGRPIHTNLLSGMESGASRPRLRTNSAASMNPAVWLVDLVSADREGLQSFLQSQQCDVDTAANGESAVSCCLEMQPDLVLLYDSLPDIGSFELCRRLKEDPLNQLTPVVLVKSSPDQWDVQRGREAGAMDIWATPPSLWDLLGRVETLLRLKKYMDEQAKSVVVSLARSVDTKQNLGNGHWMRFVGLV